MTKETLEIRWAGDLQRFAPGPDECFVLTVDEVLPADTAAAVKEQWGNFCGARLLILDRRMTLGVVSTEVADKVEGH